jgi:transmembrane sensor
MLEQEFHISELITGHLNGTLNLQQEQELKTWLELSAENRELLNALRNEAVLNGKLQDYHDVDSAELWKRAQEMISIKRPKAIQRRLWPRVAVAAAAVAAIVFGVWFYTYEVASSRKAPRNDVAYQNDVAPGKHRATITLANGKTIQLSEEKTGVVIDATNLTYNDGTVVDPLTGSSLRGGTTKQPHTSDEIIRESSVFKGTHELAKGSVAASRNAHRNDGEGADSKMAKGQGSDSKGANAKVQILTATTPRGGTYQITLPDGSKVWLNAASSLQFPAEFTGRNRVVTLVGEGYFEVAKNKIMPFIVKSKEQQVEVLGTHFNISAYENDKNTTTSLLEGSVRVSAASKGNAASPGAVSSSVLKPNQQSILKADVIKIMDIDPIQPVAWKNGYFMFASEPIGSIMKKLSRWYDVDVDYQGKITTEGFTGSVSKYENISEVLNTLELTGLVHFKIQGRRITVMP